MSNKYSKYVTEDKLKLVNQENMELGEEFIDYLNSIGRSKETIKQYKNDLLILWVLMNEKCKNKFFIEISKRDIIKIQNFMLNEQGLSPDPRSSIVFGFSVISNILS